MLKVVLLIGALAAGVSACDKPPPSVDPARQPARSDVFTIVAGEVPPCEQTATLQERQAYMLGWASLSRSEAALEGVLDCVASTWSDDPDATDTKSSVLWAVLRVSPEVFVNAMSDRQVIVDDWLGPSLEPRVFEGGFDGEPCRFTSEIAETRERVRRLKVTGDARLTQTKIVERLGRTTCSGSRRP